MSRQHPCALLGYTGGWFASAAAPAAAALSGKAPAMTAGLLLSFLPLAVYSAAALFHYFSKRYMLTGKEACLSAGVFTQSAETLGRGSVTAVRLVKDPVCGAFGALRLYLTTAGGEEKKLVLPASRAKEAVRELTGADCPEKSPSPSVLPALLYGISGSELFTAVPAVVPVLLHIGRITGAPLVSGLVDEMDAFLKKEYPFLPGIMTLTAAVLILCWCVNLLYCLFLYSGHSVIKDGGNIAIAHGRAVRRSELIRQSAVTMIEVRSSPLMSVTGRSSCFVYCAGGRRSRCLLPPRKNAEVYALRDELFGRPGGSVRAVYPDRERMTGVDASALLGGVLAAACVFCAVRLPLLSCLSGLAAFLCLRRSLAGHAGMKRQGIELSPSYLRISGLSGGSARSCFIPRGRLASVTVTRSPADMLRGTCTVTARVAGCKRPIRCGMLPYERASAVAEYAVKNKTSYNHQ